MQETQLVNQRSPLMQALDAVKLSRRCNMFDRTCVIITMQDLGYTLQADWLLAHIDDYLDILIREYSRWLQDNVPPKSESLAQRVARETGLEVVQE